MNEECEVCKRLYDEEEMEDGLCPQCADEEKEEQKYKK